MRLLAIDIGNSNIKCGLFEDSQLELTFSMASDQNASGAAYRHALRAHVGDRGPQATAIASVVPSLNERVSVAAQREFMALPQFVSAEDLNASAVAYADPAGLGADRIAAAVAGHHFYGVDQDGNRRPVVVIDAGTAVTFEAVDADGKYLGGVIWAGPRLVADALSQGTGLLPRVDPTLPKSAIGSNTEDCLKSGLLYGFLDGVSGILGRLLQETGSAAATVVTGGYGGWLVEHLEAVEAFEPHLVLHGIRLIVN